MNDRFAPRLRHHKLAIHYNKTRADNAFVAETDFKHLP